MARFRAFAGRRGAREGWRFSTIAVAILLSGCGGSQTSTGSKAAVTQNTPQAPSVPVGLHLDEGKFSVSSPGAAISGTVTRGASVTVNGQSVPVHGGHWREPLHLQIGENTIAVVATMAGRTTAESSIQVIRHHTTAELEAQARARAQREEQGKQEKQHREAELERLKRETPEEETPPKEAPEGESPGECPNGTYENSNGNTICKPYTPENGERPAGATAQCEDGTYSFSEHHSGTCSGHGGVKEWLE